MESLLDRAMSTAHKRQPISQDRVDLAVAWMKNEINTTQVGAALGIPAGGVYSMLARALKQFYLEGGMTCAGKK